VIFSYRTETILWNFVIFYICVYVLFLRYVYSLNFVSLYFCASLFLTYELKLIYLPMENNTLYFCKRAQSKCGTLDYIDHIPGGGDKKVYR